MPPELAVAIRVVICANEHSDELEEVAIVVFPALLLDGICADDAIEADVMAGPRVVVVVILWGGLNDAHSPTRKAAKRLRTMASGALILVGSD